MRREAMSRMEINALKRTTRFAWTDAGSLSFVLRGDAIFIFIVDQEKSSARKLWVHTVD